jgi:O-antigen/teichoic acid export membrane protein
MTESTPVFGHALKWATVMTAGTRAVTTGVTFLLAALLGPSDFGLFSVALVYVSLVYVLLEQGFKTAIIQREQLDPEHLDSAFWLNLGWCLLLGAFVYLSAGWWADVNNMPELESVLEVLSLLVVVEGLGIVQSALLQRSLAFKRLAVRSNLGAVLGGAVGVSLALAGSGVWALVAQQLVLESTLMVMVWALSPWRPRLRFSAAHSRQLLGFSVNVMAANLAAFVGRRADALLMGIFFGPVAVGLYRLADRFVDVVLDVTMRPVGVLSLPLLSRHQSDPERLRETAFKCLRITLLIALPGLLVVLATSDELVAVLGDEWADATVPLELLCLAGVGKAVGLLTGPVLFAVSRPRFRAVMLWAIAGVSTVAVLVVGQLLRSGSVEEQVVGMSISRALLFLVLLLPVNLVIIQHFTGLQVRVVLRYFPAPLLSGLAGVAVVFAVRGSGAIDNLAPFPALLLTGALAVLTTGSLLIALDNTTRRYARRLAGAVWSPLAAEPRGSTRASRRRGEG